MACHPPCGSPPHAGPPVRKERAFQAGWLAPIPGDGNGLPRPGPRAVVTTLAVDPTRGWPIVPRGGRIA